MAIVVTAIVNARHFIIDLTHDDLTHYQVKARRNVAYITNGKKLTAAEAILRRSALAAAQHATLLRTSARP
jgi:hypothetical protein